MALERRGPKRPLPFYSALGLAGVGIAVGGTGIVLVFAAVGLLAIALR